MKKKRMKLIINWTMLILLITVFISGILLKIIPGMWMGITHALSGILVMIVTIIHIMQHGMPKRK